MDRMETRMKILMRCWGGMFAYGMARGLRADYGQRDVLSTRVAYSITNGIFYGTCIVIPLLRLCDRIQVHVQRKDPLTYPDAYHEIFGINRNVIL